MILLFEPPAKELDFKPPTRELPMKRDGNSPIQNCTHSVPPVLSHSERKDMARYIPSVSIHTEM